MPKLDRIAIEDVLRALLECENRRHEATEAQLAGLSDMSRDRAVQRLGQADQLGLVSAPYQGVWGLTAEGRAEAVRVMRAHRLTETKLAHETSLSPERWHDVAHAREHRLTADELDALADRLGNPRFDPHGDPIPTREGHFPSPEDVPLLDWPVGSPGVIAHVEDEPKQLFARLAATGLAAGQRFVAQAADGGIELLVEGRTTFLVSSIVPLVRVRALHADELGPVAGAVRLSDLADGGSAEVVTLLPGCMGAERSRLLDLGFVPGSRIERVLSSPLHGPVAYRVRNTLIALRHSQSDQVLIKPLNEGKSS